MQSPNKKAQFCVALRLAFVGVCLLGNLGCGALLTIPQMSDPHQLLKAVETSPESLTLEIFQVRIPSEDEQLAEELWSEVDEQRIDLETRRGLTRNGFRAGVLAGHIPEALVSQFQGDADGATQEDGLLDDEKIAARVVRRLIQLKRSDQASVQASDLRKQINVLVNSEDGLHGQSYDQVQAAYNLRVEPASGQRARLRLTPELQHGELRNRYAGSDQGIFLVTPSRERVAYDDLALRTELSAGEFLVVGSLPDSAGTLGWAFHGIEVDGPAEQKLVLVRLLQLPPSEILADRFLSAAE